MSIVFLGLFLFNINAVNNIEALEDIQVEDRFRGRPELFYFDTVHTLRLDLDYWENKELDINA